MHPDEDMGFRILTFMNQEQRVVECGRSGGGVVATFLYRNPLLIIPTYVHFTGLKERDNGLPRNVFLVSQCVLSKNPASRGHPLKFQSFSESILLLTML